VPHFLSPARVEASTEMPRILHESEENLFEEIAIDDKFWFQYSHPGSKMFRRLPRDVIQRTRQAIGTKESILTIFFTGRKQSYSTFYQMEANSASYILSIVLFLI
jgi:hypothetical protein